MSQAESGISYLPHPSIQQNVREGLDAGDIQVIECAHTWTLSRGYLFCVRDGASERDLDLFVSREHYAPLCQCQQDTLPCKHAFWLMDKIFLTATQVYGYIPEVIYLQADGRATTEPAGMCRTLLSTAVIIDAITIDKLGSLRNWHVRGTETPGAGGSDPGAGGANQGDRPLESRLKLLIGILQPSDAVFSEFSRCTAQLNDRDGEKALKDVWEQFKGLMQTLLNDGTANQKQRLDAMLTPDFCVAAELVQLKFRYRETLRSIDELDPLFVQDPTPCFTKGAVSLCEHANEIASLYGKQIVWKPGHVWYLAGLLVDVLLDVMARDYSKWSNSRGSAQHEDSASNLYVRLVGDPPRERGLLCALETLGSIHPSILRSHKDLLRRIGWSLREVGESKHFISKFHEVLGRCNPGM